jgi:hypothetical protein
MQRGSLSQGDLAEIDQALSVAKQIQAVLVMGISRKSAPVRVLERAAVSGDQLASCCRTWSAQSRRQRYSWSRRATGCSLYA